VRAVLDMDLDVVLGELVALSYDRGGSPEDDVPAHVRAASALRGHRGRLVIVQDDVNVLALRDDGGGVEALLLPIGAGGRRVFDDARGNKAAKLDLEAAAALPDGRLALLGSGSTSARERIVVLDRSCGVRVVDARELYASLREVTSFAGSELNIEGAVVVGDAIRLFQRGNGARRGPLSPVNATGDLPLEPFLAWLDGQEPPPRLQRIVPYDLGSVEGVPFTFTDAALTAEGRVVFIACAEDSPDAVHDGVVLGCRFGILEDDRARVADVRDAAGMAVTLKLEGLEPRPGSPSAFHATFDVVIDTDRPEEPALLGKLEVRGAL
jgi:hypothetical protein